MSLRFAPEIRCMQYAKFIRSNVGDSWLKRGLRRQGCAINFGTRPRVQLFFFICFFYFISVQFYFLFFAARILCLAGCSQKDRRPGSINSLNLKALKKQTINRCIVFSLFSMLLVFFFKFCSVFHLFPFCVFILCFSLVYVFCVFFFVSAKSLNSKAGLEFKEIRLFPMFLFSKKMKFDLFAKSTVFDFLQRNFPNKNTEIFFLNVFFLQHIIVGKVKIL